MREKTLKKDDEEGFRIEELMRSLEKDQETERIRKGSQLGEISLSLSNGSKKTFFSLGKEFVSE